MFKSTESYNHLSFKQVFSDLGAAKCFLLDVLGEELKDYIDFNSILLDPGAYIYGDYHCIFQCSDKMPGKRR